MVGLGLVIIIYGNGGIHGLDRSSIFGGEQRPNWG